MILKATQKKIAKGGMTVKTRESMGPRMCNDLGLWVLDNGKQHCITTPACKDCYNNKCAIYPAMKANWLQRMGKDDLNWYGTTPQAFAGLNRVRLNTRGEGLGTFDNIERVASWIQGNPQCKFWIVTRAHQQGAKGYYRPAMDRIEAIEQNIMIFPNAYVMASLDEYIEHHWYHLVDRGWSTIYYQKNNKAPIYASDPRANVHKCRKTWTKVINPKTGRPVHPKMVCKNCRNGCYGDQRVDVWLGYHQ